MPEQISPTYETESPDGAEISLALRSLLGARRLQLQFGKTVSHPHMPVFQVQRSRGEPLTPLSQEAQEIIRDRAMSIITPPLGSPLNSAGIERALDWARGKIGGSTDEEIAMQQGYALSTLRRAFEQARSHLGTSNPPSTMLSMITHGYEPRIIQPELSDSSCLSPNEELHLHLAATGFSEKQAAKLAGCAESTAKNHRQLILKKCGALSITQAVGLLYVTQNFNEPFFQYTPYHPWPTLLQLHSVRSDVTESVTKLPD